MPKTRSEKSFNLFDRFFTAVDSAFLGGTRRQRSRQYDRQHVASPGTLARVHFGPILLVFSGYLLRGQIITCSKNYFKLLLHGVSGGCLPILRA